MKHLRSDWNGIQDTNQQYYHKLHPSPQCSSIREDEPVFLLRAKDPLAGHVVREWASELFARGGDKELADRVYRWSFEMERYAEANFTREECHLPTTPEDTLLP